MNYPKYTKFKDATGAFRFNLRAENGEIILHSEAYSASKACDDGIASVRLNSPFDSQYARKTSVNSQYFFVLKARNGEIIGTSELYTSSFARENGITAVKRVGPTAPVDDIS